jgi:RND family efflux transporter MFP subunit
VQPEREQARRDDLASLRIERTEDEHAPAHRRPLLWVAGGVAVLLVLALGYRASLRRAVAVEVAVVVAHAPGEVVRSPVLSGTGYVVTAEKYIDIGVRVAGRIERYDVDEGDTVSAGDPLVELDDRDYRARLDQAKATRGTARADLALHESELRRTRALFGSGIVARQELDEMENKVAVDHARIQQAEADVTQAEVDLGDTVLRAPRDGVVLAKLKEVGEIAVPGGFAGSGDLVRMANLDEMRAEVDVNESDLRLVHLGQAAEVIPDAYPDHAYRAEVVKLYPQVNRQKGTLKIEVRIRDADARLLPDMSVRVNFLAAAAPAAPDAVVVVAPRVAIREDASGAYAWVVVDGRARKREVTVGADLGDLLEIRAGLGAEDTVVVSDASELTEGARVQVGSGAGA